MRFWQIGLSVLMFAVSGAAHAGGASDITVLLGRDPGEAAAYACFSRQYTDKHMARHPQQNVTAMRVYVAKAENDNASYEIDMQVDFREQKNPLVLTNACESGYDPAKAITCPLDCDGGRIDLSVKNQSAILVDIPIGARVYNPPEEDGVPVRGKFGEDDKLFRLDRVKLADCLPMIKDETLRARIAKGDVAN